MKIFEEIANLLEVTPKIGMGSNFREELKNNLAKKTVGIKDSIESYGILLRFIDTSLQEGKIRDEEHRLLHSTIAEIKNDKEKHLKNLNILWDKFIGPISKRME